MKAKRDIAGRRGPMALAAFVLLQSTAAVFFVGDALSDMLTDPSAPHSVFESLVALALTLGVVFGAWALRQTLEQMRAQSRALRVARGALADAIEAQFTIWGLTPAERDVALFALKGLDVAEIAALRGAAQGTVRVQLTHVYAKAGVSNRAQFAAWVVEDLLG
jgi:DNA-binding CsgD family transcriptional regulator